MIPGHVISPWEIAIRISSLAALVRPVMEGLADRGALTRVRVSHVKQPKYMITGTEKLVEKVEKYVGIPAGARLAPNLQSTLAGYDREISRRVELALATRGK
ncbi:hypothetical protein vBSbQDWS_11 [Shewanella phage vB_Sb_QDWS]|nr:hypothetical protein vBSbQDWS_11 [Shewanella phage vB_Sb_QDWS]